MYTEHEGNACELLLDMLLKYSQVQIFESFVSSNGALFLYLFIRVIHSSSILLRLFDLALRPQAFLFIKRGLPHLDLVRQPCAI